MAWFVARLRRLFALPAWVLHVSTFCLLLMPYWGPLRVGNKILSEGFAYPLFLLALGHLLTALVQRRSRGFWFFFLFTGRSVLNRPQFLFLYPVGIAAVGWACVAWGQWKRRLVLVRLAVHLS